MTIVLDASALVELILDTPAGALIAERIADPAEGLHTPHLADLEVVQALRRYIRKEKSARAPAPRRSTTCAIWISSAMPTSRCSSASGICATTSRPTMPSTSRWPRFSTPSC